jgi:hypothetical protein
MDLAWKKIGDSIKNYKGPLKALQDSDLGGLLSRSLSSLSQSTFWIIPV